VLIERSIEIARPREEVFDFVSDPLNDPLWCPKVESVRPAPGSTGGPGARFEVVHRPIPLRPAREMDYTLTSWDPPGEIVWREDDGHDVIVVTYSLEAIDEGTRFTQRDDAELGAPRLLHPLMRAGIGADVARQLRRLRRHLEG
jgi:hypothetical protein